MFIGLSVFVFCYVLLLKLIFLLFILQCNMCFCWSWFLIIQLCQKMSWRCLDLRHVGASLATELWEAPKFAYLIISRALRCLGAQVAPDSPRFTWRFLGELLSGKMWSVSAMCSCCYYCWCWCCCWLCRTLGKFAPEPTSFASRALRCAQLPWEPSLCCRRCFLTPDKMWSVVVLKRKAGDVFDMLDVAGMLVNEIYDAFRINQHYSRLIFVWYSWQCLVIWTQVCEVLINRHLPDIRLMFALTGVADLNGP